MVNQSFKCILMIMLYCMYCNISGAGLSVEYFHTAALLFLLFLNSPETQEVIIEDEHTVGTLGGLTHHST